MRCALLWAALLVVGCVGQALLGIQSAPDGSLFTLLMRGKPWLTWPAPTLFTDGAWQKLTPHGQAERISGDDDFGGAYDGSQWEFSGGSGARMVVSVRLYAGAAGGPKEQEGPAAVLLRLSFPEGAVGTNHTAAPPVTQGGCDPNSTKSEVAPCAAFPSVIPADEAPALGYLTWIATMSPAYMGKWPPSAGNLGGLMGGPVVLFDASGDAVVMSAADHFLVSSQYREASGAWSFGLSGELERIPPGFYHDFVFVAAAGVTQVMYDFGACMQSLYHTSRLPDVVTSHLGYWTDNGAYYYGDSWEGATSDRRMNLTCCSLEKMVEIAQGLEEANIPVRYWQMDDWWYLGPHPHIGWGGVKGVQNWAPPEEYYPGGLSALREKLGVPLLLYGPYFSPDNVWAGDFTFIPQGGDHMLPTPADSEGFYSSIFTYGLDHGMSNYEVDFMSCLSTSTPLFRTDVSAGRDWLRGMNAAGVAKGVPIQYCMADPADILSGLENAAATNGRASGDYCSPRNYHIGLSSILFWSLNFRPSKDNFWTNAEQPICPNNHYPCRHSPFGADADRNCTELHTIVATLSTGPVGISDGAGETNATLIMRSCMSNGRLLQPDKPPTAIDSFIIGQALGVPVGPDGQVWLTYAEPDVGMRWYYVLGIDVEKPYSLLRRDLWPLPPSGMAFAVRDWHAPWCGNGTNVVQGGCVTISKPGSEVLATINPTTAPPHASHGLRYMSLAPIPSTAAPVLMGEINKYVGVSRERFTQVSYEGNRLAVDMIGEEGEKVTLAALRPGSNEGEWIAAEVTATIPETGASRVVFI